MPKWPRHPKIFEINTWVWLSDLSQKYEGSRNLASVPAREWDAIAANVERVPLLAARWSLDPAAIDEVFLERERGIAGEPPRRY
jgi:hypothetical protein